MSGISEIAPDVLEQDEHTLERLSEDIGKLYRSIGDLPNEGAYSALCRACDRFHGCTNGKDVAKLREHLGHLRSIVDGTLRGLLERRGEPPSKRRLRRVQNRPEPWTAWWAPYFPEPPRFEFTAEDIKPLASCLDRFPDRQVSAFIGHRPRPLLIRTGRGLPRINGARIEGVEMHLRGWIQEWRQFSEQKPSNKASWRRRKPSRTVDIEELELMSSRIEHIQDSLFERGLFSRLADNYLWVHERLHGQVQEDARALRLLADGVAGAIEFIRASPDRRKPFEWDLVRDLAIDYKLAFGVTPSAKHEETTFMKFLAELENVVAGHRYKVMIQQAPPSQPRVVELNLRHKLKIGRDLAKRVIKEELGPI